MKIKINNEVSQNVQDIELGSISLANIIDLIRPVGSLYWSANNIDPSTIYPGTTWQAITDTWVVAAGSTYKAGTAYGAATHTHASAAHTHTVASHTHTTGNHTLTVAEMPSHTHSQNAHYHAGLSYGNPDGGGNTCVVSTTYTGTGCIELGWSRSSTGYPYDNVYTKYATATNNNTGGGQAHNHGNTGSTTLTTNSTTPGNTGSASNVPPSVAKYCWQRIS